MTLVEHFLLIQLAREYAAPQTFTGALALVGVLTPVKENDSRRQAH